MGGFSVAQCRDGLGLASAGGGIRNKPLPQASLTMMLPSSPQLRAGDVDAASHKRDHRAAFHRDLVQLAAARESDPLPVRREERCKLPLAFPGAQWLSVDPAAA